MLPNLCFARWSEKAPLVICFVVGRQNLVRKVLVSRWVLQLLIVPSVAYFHSRVTYGVYHLIYYTNMFIVHQHL